jgi:PAS domain S-box-containing protein
MPPLLKKIKTQKQPCAITPVTVTKRLKKIILVLQKMAIGDFSENIKIPQKEDEFTELLVAVDLMADDLREISKKESEKTKELADKVKDLENTRSALLNVTEDASAKSRELAEAKSKNEAILASIADGCIAVNNKGEIILMNQMAQDMLGYTSKESIGKQWYKILHRQDKNGNPISPEKGAIRAALSSSSTTTTTTTVAISSYYLRKDGTTFPISRTVSPITLQGKIIGAVNVFRDITREKEIEKIRMDFLSLASHQLRTPLSGTKWLIETMQKGITGKLNSKQKEYLDNIYQVNERLIKLVSDMLNVLMLESGVAVIKKEKVSLDKLCEELFLTMEPAARNKGIKLCCALKNQPLLWLETDSQILRNILECFISNAISYSHQGQEVVLDAKEESLTVVFSVKDSGIGIPKEEQSKMFEKFYRTSNAKEFKPDGTGLGLYIASMLARKLGGKIYFESEEGKGSVFYVKMLKKIYSTGIFNNN